VYHTGTETTPAGAEVNVMVMEILGPDLKTLVPDRARGPTGLPTTFAAKVMIFALTALEYLHSRDYLHQDIKPNNMVLARRPGGGGGVCVYLVDLGISKRFRSREGEHIAYTEDHKMVGTVHYASVNNHLGIELSRRDDLECLAYVALYLLRPGLPWAGIQKGEGRTRRAKWLRTQECKLGFTGDKLFEGHAPEFGQFLSYAWSLGFDEKPNYEYLRELFREVLRREAGSGPYVEDILESEIPQETLSVYRNWMYKDWGLDINKGADDGGKKRSNKKKEASSSSYYYYGSSSSSS
jgi:serine/threonine protein kinase